MTEVKFRLRRTDWGDPKLISFKNKSIGTLESIVRIMHSFIWFLFNLHYTAKQRMLQRPLKFAWEQIHSFVVKLALNSSIFSRTENWEWREVCCARGVYWKVGGSCENGTSGWYQSQSRSVGRKELEKVIIYGIQIGVPRLFIEPTRSSHFFLFLSLLLQTMNTSHLLMCTFYTYIF